MAALHSGMAATQPVWHFLCGTALHSGEREKDIFVLDFLHITVTQTHDF